MSASPATLSLAVPVALAAALAAADAAAQSARVVERMWAGDDTLWGPAGQPEVADRLGWMYTAERTGALLPQLTALAAGARERGDRVVLVLGMGGSSLAPEVLRRAFAAVDGAAELRVLDSTVPTAVLEAMHGLDPKHTLVIAASKSGGTLETRSQLELMWEQLDHRGDAFIAITDPGSALERLAGERGFRAVLVGDPEVGGRYSALTAFGLGPAALAGFDTEALLAGGTAAADASHDASADGNEALALGLLFGVAAQAGRDKLTILADPSLGGVELWLEQLIAESTGKLGHGLLPVAGESGGAAARFGDDRVVLRIRDAGKTNGALDALTAQLADQGAPIATLSVDGPTDLGAIFFTAEFATAVSGWQLGINPFDQPNVQEAKDATRDVLEAAGTTLALPATPIREAVTTLLDGLATPGYVAILGYLAPSPSVDQAATRLRSVIRDASGVATTYGYGPRYLHSTGQFHKGGPDGGRFLIVVDDAAPDVAIPGSEHSFRTLAHAQALGDLRALHAHGRTAVLVTTGGAPAETLHELADRAAKFGK